MLIYLYEHLTALGLGRDPGDLLHGMFREGLAMRDALAADLAAIPGCRVTFDETQSDSCEASVVIAPETGGVLLDLARRFAKNFVGCSLEAIELTGDKLALSEHWRKHGVRTPATTDREPTPCEAFPVVWKPRDGCGSASTFLLKDQFDLARAKATLAREPFGPMILQEHVEGRAASVAFLCGPAGNVPLLPAFQNLSSDGCFTYLGGELPIPPRLAARAVSLASHALERIDGLGGYVGVDLVLGEAEDGSQDWAIEVNPRLTTSYVGLRVLADFNIAEAMLACAVPSLALARAELRWKPDRVRFSSDGSVSPAGPA